MAKIDAKMVKELRERTGAGMMDCKKALTETDGDMDKAIDYLREKGIAKAEKKAGRIASEGVVAAYVADDAKVAALVEINCETDFVAVTEKFHALCDKIAKHIAETNPTDLDALNASTLEGKKSSRKLSRASVRRFHCAVSSAMRTLRAALQATSTWAARSACSLTFRAARRRSARTSPCTSQRLHRRQSTVRA